MSKTTANPDALIVHLDRLFVPENVREEDEEFIARLERSVKARGRIITPVEVIDADPAVHGDAYDYVLVAGFRRVEVTRRLGHDTVPGVYGDAEHEHTDRAVENIVRSGLNPYEEAVAIQRLLAEGSSEERAADLLGMSKGLVTRRVKLLELPHAAQRLVGEGTLSLATVDPMRMIAQANPVLLDAVVDFIGHDEVELAPDDFAHTPLSILAAAVEATELDVFAEPLGEVPLRNTDLLPDDEPTLALIAKARELHKEIHRFSYGDPHIRFTQADADRARAAGVLLEYGEEALVTDREMYRDLCRTAIAAAVETMTQQAAERAEEEKSVFGASGEKVKAAADSEQALLEKQHRADMRAHAATAHSANLDLGDSLKKGLTVVDPDDINVARFFVYGLLSRNHSSDYHRESVVAAIALRGIRLVISEFREDKTKIRNDKSRGALRIVYGDGTSCTNQEHWLWNYLDGARSAGELYGRALVVIAAERYASRRVLPASQQSEPLRWPSHNDTALTALTKLAGPHIAKTLLALEEAIEAAEREHKEALKALSSKKSDAEAGGDGDAEQDAADADGVAAQALSVIEKQPGISIPELAGRMGVKQNCLYRVLPKLEDQGKVSRHGRGWYPTASKTTVEDGAPATLPGLAADAQDERPDPDEPKSGGGSGEPLPVPIDASTIQPPNEGPAPMPELPEDDLPEEDLPEEVVPDAADVLDAAAEIDF